MVTSGVYFLSSKLNLTLKLQELINMDKSELEIMRKDFMLKFNAMFDKMGIMQKKSMHLYMNRLNAMGLASIIL